MKLPEIKDAKKYQGLYVIDLGQSCSVGFTAGEVAEVLESERYAGKVKIYRICGATPDGQMCLRGVPEEVFHLEGGMFFGANDLQTAEADFARLVEIEKVCASPSRAKVHLGQMGESEYVVGLIYPAEYDGQFSRWLLDADYKTVGAAWGGVSAVEQYYQRQVKVLQRHQLMPAGAGQDRSGEELFDNLKVAVQR